MMDQSIETNQSELDTAQIATPNKSSLSFTLIISVIILMAISGVIGYYFGLKNTSWEPSPESRSKSNDVICTLDAKICPDGSSVGRVGPNCEFEQCQDTSNNNSTTETDRENWTLYENAHFGYQIYYPSDWKAIDMETSDLATTQTLGLLISPYDNISLGLKSSITIEQVGIVDVVGLEEVTIYNSTMYRGESEQETFYYVLVPDSREFIKITIIENSTTTKETSVILASIFETFAFQIF